jgi:hypothetical protein
MVDTCPTCQRDHAQPDRKVYYCVVCRRELCDECWYDGEWVKCENCGDVICAEHAERSTDPDLRFCPRCKKEEERNEQCQMTQQLALR